MALELKLQMTFGSEMLSASEGMSFLKKIVDFLEITSFRSRCVFLKKYLSQKKFVDFLHIFTLRSKYCYLEKIVDFLLLWLLEVNVSDKKRLLLLEVNVFLWEIPSSEENRGVLANGFIKNQMSFNEENRGFSMAL